MGFKLSRAYRNGTEGREEMRCVRAPLFDLSKRPPICGLLWHNVSCVSLCSSVYVPTQAKQVSTSGGVKVVPVDGKAWASI